MKTKFISIKNLFKDGQQNEHMISLGNRFELPALIRELGNRMVASCFPGKVKFTNRFKQLSRFSNHILSKTRRHGPVYTVNYLKCCQLAVQKCIAKDKITSLRELNPSFPFPRLSKSNLPKIIPLSDRRAIVSGSPAIIRW
jgi:hypothetical protein